MTKQKHLSPPVAPNKAWVEEHEGEKLQLEWPDGTYVVEIMGADDG